MEPAQATVSFRIATRVLDIARIDKTHRVDHDGTQHVANLGWFILLDGSRERLFVGLDEPAIRVGDEVEILIRKKP